MEEKTAYVLDTTPTTEQVVTAEPETLPRTWTDAPTSANVRAMIGGHDWQLTVRADTLKELVVRISFVNEWLDKHGNGKNKPQPAVQTPTVAAPTTVPVVILAPGVQPAQPAAPAQQAVKQINTMEIVRIETTPRADGKVDLKLFQAEHQFQDLYTAKTPDALIALLAQVWKFTPAHFVTAAKFDIKCLADWVESDKMNKNGKPYKNIVAIRPMQATA